MSGILDKINAFYTTYRTIANAIIAVTAILGILTIGYTYVQKADANELAITKRVCGNCRCSYRYKRNIYTYSHSYESTEYRSQEYKAD